MSYRNIPEPLNAEERYLFGICERLDVLIEMMRPKEEPEVLEEQVTIEEVMEEVVEEAVEEVVEEVVEEDESDEEVESDEDRVLRELLERKDYEKMLKDQLLVILSHRSDADASKYMKKDELIQMAKDTDPDKEG